MLHQSQIPNVLPEQQQLAAQHTTKGEKQKRILKSEGSDTPPPIDRPTPAEVVCYRRVAKTLEKTTQWQHLLLSPSTW